MVQSASQTCNVLFASSIFGCSFWLINLRVRTLYDPSRETGHECSHFPLKMLLWLNNAPSPGLCSVHEDYVRLSNFFLRPTWQVIKEEYASTSEAFVQRKARPTARSRMSRRLGLCGFNLKRGRHWRCTDDHSMDCERLKKEDLSHLHRMIKRGCLLDMFVDWRCNNHSRLWSKLQPSIKRKHTSFSQLFYLSDEL